MNELILAVILMLQAEEKIGCTLEVRVIDAQGPLPGALVHLLQKGHEPRIVPANADGKAKFEGLSTSATYFAGATFPGYMKTGRETSCPAADGKPVVLTLGVPDAKWDWPPEPKKKPTPQRARNSL
jgi:hypothetical protein